MSRRWELANKLRWFAWDSEDWGMALHYNKLCMKYGQETVSS